MLTTVGTAAGQRKDALGTIQDVWSKLILYCGISLPLVFELLPTPQKNLPLTQQLQLKRKTNLVDDHSLSLTFKKCKFKIQKLS